MKNNKVYEDLIELSDEDYKEFHKGLCPTNKEILGVRTPILREYAKQMVKDNEWKDFLINGSENYYEELMLKGMLIGEAKISIEDTLEYLKTFIPKIDNWAICDGTCSELKITKKNLNVMFKFLLNYLKSDKEFEIRFALVMLLNYYMLPEYIDAVLEIFNNIHYDGYYVRMAVAWGISVAFVKFENKTMKLLKDNEIDNYTYNKAIQKINESYRVKKEVKEKLKTMKRK